MWFYTVIAMALGGFCILSAAGLIDPAEIFSVFQQYLQEPKGRMVIGLVGTLIILLWFRLVLVMLESFKQKAIVITDNKEAYASITVPAIEEMTKKLIVSLNGIKDLRVRVFPSKKSIRVFIQMVLIAGVNIPELLADVQAKVKEKISGVVGEDKKIQIKLVIRRIISSKNDESTTWEPQVPYREYS